MPDLFRRIHPVLIFALIVASIFLVLPQRSLSASREPRGSVVPEVKDTGVFGLVDDLTPILITPVPTPTPSPTVTQTVNQYFPLIVSTNTPALELLDFYIRDEAGISRAAFQPGEPHTYLAEGVNNRMSTLTADFQFIQTSACGDRLIYSDTVNLAAGSWQQAIPSPGLDCTGIYTTTVSLIHENITPTLATQHVVNPPSTVQTSGYHGFDRCHLPTVEEMQAWWDSSPYYVYNLYIGGISFFCWEEIPDPVWVHQVAQQGWTFIQAWVGPQAPCTSYTHRISADSGEAYQEGRAEAAAAAAASRKAGLFENGVIYYDIEGYPNASSSCRAAVKSFLRGWTAQLHELGLKSGSYGSPCNSYVTDWASINPPPDDVWIAHWYRSYFDPAATVWDTPCLSNSLWADHKRIKQYAGGHVETWGEVSMEIDSDVLDGEITSLPANNFLAVAAAPEVTINKYGNRLSGIGLLSPKQGWVLADMRLKLTSDGGATWKNITPPGFDVLDAGFLDAHRVWVLGWLESGEQLAVARTEDGGAHWSTSTLPLGSQAEIGQIETGWLEVLDDYTGWVSLKLQSGSSFSLGRLFATTDGGGIWQERSLPLAERVKFVDESSGWTAGGPAGDGLFYTRDGGFSWSARSLALPDDTRARLGQPQFSNRQTVWIPALLEGPAGLARARFTTFDGGVTWRLEGEQPVDQRLPSPVLLAATEADGWGAQSTFAEYLPAGAVEVVFVDPWNSWAIVQQGSCTGKPNAVGNVGGRSSNHVMCDQAWRLLATSDGGLIWREILP